MRFPVEAVADLQGLARFLGGSDHAEAVGLVGSHRLLTDDVLALAESIFGDRAVRVIRGDDIDNVDVVTIDS